MFTYNEDNNQYYCDEYQFYALNSLTYEDVMLMLDRDELSLTGDDSNSKIIDVQGG